ncbi:MAG: thiamine-phosphate kinase [Alphaproteobacteria bacterium]|nr:thiamine-phosphate kinase [Alphaproteobacteria bacterium]
MHEFEMIRDYFRPLTMGRKEAGGLLDDAAILDVPDGYDLVMSSDTLCGGVHFLDDESADNIAHKCLRVNLSDMAAMGAVPYCYQLNLAFSRKPDAAWAKIFTEALMEDNRAFEVFCSGGDTTVIEGPMLVSLTITGLVPKGKAVKRSGAKAGDLVVVTGNIGNAVIGLKVLLGILDVDDPAEFTTACHCPMPRTAIAEAVHTYANAAVDISDGMIADLSHICGASGLGAQVHGDKIPFSDGAKRLMEQGVISVEDLITGGDDYELALAVAPEDFEAFKAQAAERGVCVCAIGTFVSFDFEGDAVQVLDASGEPMAFESDGWTHF